ncbi:MAG: phospholipase [Candidatus Azobacteroides sp.]|nr:phospholipase [Candidatus Azobacteroides sp.]
MKLKKLFASELDYTQNPFATLDSEGCCGKHEFCIKNLLPPSTQHPVEYYEDEELDFFKNRPSDSYSGEEIEQFAEILHTLWESDIADWIHSLRLREIELPDPLKDEVILILNS